MESGFPPSTVAKKKTNKKKHTHTTKTPALGTVVTNKDLQSTQKNTDQEVGESQAGTHTESHAFVEGGDSI